MVGTFFLVVQCQAIFILTGFSVAWHWAAWRRRLGRRKLERRGTARSAYCIVDARVDDVKGTGYGTSPGRDASEPHNIINDAPRVTVVLPEKRFDTETLVNWRTQLNSDYVGDLEYIFVVERETDGAVFGFEQLIRGLRDDGMVVMTKLKSIKFLGALNVKHYLSSGQSYNRSARLVIAGSSTTCSQKIHSMVCGIENASRNSKLILFLDDDIRTHGNTIGVLVESMIGDKTNKNKPFLSNGFPFDLPCKHAPFTNYLTMVYHLVLLIAFSHGDKCFNVWGGCMMVALDDFRSNKHNILSKYNLGGYSDDLILAAMCDEFSETVKCPFELIFPQRMSVKQSFEQWWNYLRRQLFVMDTYSSNRNKQINHGMLGVLSYLSFAATGGMSWGMWRIIVWVFSVLVYGKDDVVYGDKYNVMLPFLTLFSFVCALRAAKSMYRELGSLSNVLGDKSAQSEISDIQWWKVGVAFWVTYSIVPVAVVVTVCKNTIEWAGIRYRKRKGKVVRVA